MGNQTLLLCFLFVALASLVDANRLSKGSKLFRQQQQQQLRATKNESEPIDGHRKGKCNEDFFVHSKKSSFNFNKIANVVSFCSVQSLQCCYGKCLIKLCFLHPV